MYVARSSAGTWDRVGRQRDGVIQPRLPYRLQWKAVVSGALAKAMDASHARQVGAESGIQLELHCFIFRGNQCSRSEHGQGVPKVKGYSWQAG